MLRGDGDDRVVEVAHEALEKGIEEIICIAVNDPFVLKAWGEATGAAEAGITLLGDADAAFTKALGMAFTVPAIGFYDRANRYALVVDGGSTPPGL